MLESVEQIVAVGGTTALTVAATGFLVAKRRPDVGVAEAYWLANPLTAFCAYGAAVRLDAWLVPGAHGLQHTLWYACAHWGSAPAFGLVTFAMPLYAVAFEATARTGRRAAEQGDEADEAQDGTRTAS
jgi:hypothetical protein